RAMNRAAKALADQERQVPGMVEGCVAEDNRRNLPRRELRLQPVSQAELLESLEQAAVEHHLLTAILDQIPGAGDRAGGTEELKGRGCRHREGSWDGRGRGRVNAAPHRQ